MGAGEGRTVSFDELRKLASGYQPAALFLAALELGVFDALSDGPLDAGELAARIGANPRATRIAANGLASLGLLVKVGERFANSEGAAELLVSSSPGYKGSILRHLGNSWGDYTELPAAWRAGSAKCARKEGAVPKDPQGLKNFILGMENMTREAAPVVADLLDLAGCRRILDLGAGPGNYCLAFAARAPNAAVVHFDLPETSAVAKDFVAGKPGAERIEFLSGDFLTDPLGDGYDFVWLSQILHMLSEGEAAALVARAANALAPGGRLAVHEHFLEEDMVSPLSAALFGVHMLAVTKGGRAYSFGEVEGMMSAAGLRPSVRLEYGGPSRIAVGVRS